MYEKKNTIPKTTHVHVFITATKVLNQYTTAHTNFTHYVINKMSRDRIYLNYV